ncbi:MAG: PD-(D/E)XK nuclease family protein [Flavobacteriaceae bacterium]|nr:PD-(D/E)XK nuclease family protein [Flavobacteriaceae bacterium]
MKTFLDEISKKIISLNYQFKDVKIVVPNKRAISFFKKSLSNNLSKPEFSPEIISIEDFMGEMSGLKKIQRIDLLFQFYEIYKTDNIGHKIDDFNEFLRWANTALDDFDEIDFHLLNADDFFEYESSLARIEEWAKGNSSNDLVKNHSSFFNSLKIYYEKIYKNLIHENKGSLGIIFREAVGNLEIYLQNTNKFHFFIGFNALNKCESQVFQEFLSLKKGEIIWDIDKFLYDDESNSAGKFIRKYFNEWNYLRQKKESFTEKNFELEKKISLVGIPKNVGQSKYAAEISEKFHNQSKKEKTVIVLGKETLLTPLLSGFSKNETKWNVTMGHPISQTPSSDFFDLFFKMHINISSNGFYYKNIHEILTASWVKEMFQFNKINIMSDIEKLVKANQSLIDPLFFIDQNNQNNLKTLFFKKFKDSKDFINRLINISDFFISFFGSIGSETIFLELNHFKRIKEIFLQLLGKNKIDLLGNDISSIYKTFKFLIRSEKVNFSTDSSEGIQIMGLLETRLLDFENVIITNVNEGVLPPGKKNHSFISFESRKKFGMFTFLDKDAIYTYHFYRLIQRAKNIFLIYNIKSEGLNSGEKSRFIYQLKFNNLKNHDLKEINLGYDFQKQYSKIDLIKKTEQVEKRLAEISSKGFSPSSLIEYLTDPIGFYYKRILKIKETEKVESTISYKDRGTIVHKVLEDLYKPYLNKILRIEDFNLMEKNIEDLINEKYELIYGRSHKKIGLNYIIHEVLKKHIKDFILKEKNLVKDGRTLEIIYLEKDLEKNISIPSLSSPVKLIGQVDRIDKLDGVTRIIDYKTGKILPSNLKLSKIENLFSETQFASSFQLLNYFYLYSSYLESDDAVQAGIISFKNLDQYFMPLSLSGSQKNNFIDFSILSLFEKSLIDLIIEIFNREIPFRRME